VRVKLFIILLLLSQVLEATKIKELTNVRGVRENQLIGYGLVVGLNGVGDGSSSKFTQRAVASMLQSVNVRIDAKDIKSKNVAAVMVTATLPPFSRHGDKIDVEVSSMGDAKSIVGGTLLLTPLKSVDGEIYALAQGKIEKGYIAQGAKAPRETSAKIYEGALVEREVGFDIYHKNRIELSLKKSDFHTAVRVQNVINKTFGVKAAVAIDPRTIEITRPANLSMVEFLARVDEINLYGVKTERIVIDQKSGTVVSGADIMIEPIIISQGDLTLKIEGANKLPSGRDHQYVSDTASINVKNNVVSMRRVTVDNVTRVLQKMGSKPAEIIAIIQTMKKQGAIRAELEII
jgi:flagellar P-ring protein precursor FlgI